MMKPHSTVWTWAQMNPGATQSSMHDRQERQFGRMLVAAAILCLVASGGILWWRYGGGVFNDMVLAGLAWCF